MKTVLTCDQVIAKKFFFREKCYCNFDLPSYFTFSELINDIDLFIKDKSIQEFFKNKSKPPSSFENVNYVISQNKDGKYAWRPLQLIHPVLYVSLVNTITTEHNWNTIKSAFSNFYSNSNIKCFSLPVLPEESYSLKEATISNWWQKIEQQSIELSLKYGCLINTDISDCYGSIYTHSIPWSIHTKQYSKQHTRDKDLLGNNIDLHLRWMSYGQTNGIPQGSVLMDFISELVLGSADLELSKKLDSKSIYDYEIIRYRDDYRIFCNNPTVGESILKILTEVLFELGMKLNPHKTKISSNIISDCIKEDKLYWITTIKTSKKLLEHMLLIHDLSVKYPNSGSVVKSLDAFFKRILKVAPKNNIKVLISILVDIMLNNPKTYSIGAAILSVLISLLKENDRIPIIEQIFNKFERIPNTGHLQVWLQRITMKLDPSRTYSEKLCMAVVTGENNIWNSEWVDDFIREIIICANPIINNTIISSMAPLIQSDEVLLFNREYL